MDRTLIATVVVILAALGYFALQPGGLSRAHFSLGPETPVDLKFTAVDGTEVNLAKMRGKVVLIDFWATWCGPCREEVPNVVAAYEKYHSRGFEIVGVSLDEDKDELLSVTRENGMAWPQFFDGHGWGNEVAERFGIHSIPAMWLVGKDGKVITTNARGDLAGQVEQALAMP